MCGLIFKAEQRASINAEYIAQLKKISWRGPDARNFTEYLDGRVFLGHCRLAILDLSELANQPLISSCGDYAIVFNGEIYNHLEIRRELNIICKTSSDTETIIEGYKKIGKEIFSMLDGMFAIVIYEIKKNQWVASRDAFGLKPLFIHQTYNKIIISSEASTIAEIINAAPDPLSIEEWKLIRRPCPGHSYFQRVQEVLPGTVIDSFGNTFNHWEWVPSCTTFVQEYFEQLLVESVQMHELSDVDNVSLLSGGLDSAIIAALSKVKNVYTVGLVDNNEFDGAQETATSIMRHLKRVAVTPNELIESWKKLTKLRREPLSLPNEGLIYLICSQMKKTEKVVLTGEGADELFFGYDLIFRWACGAKEINIEDFLLKYGYSSEIKSERLVDFVQNINKNKKPIDFLEDFFYQVHLPGLLRRMDFASMAASKEARVPFINKSMIRYSYRQPISSKLDQEISKIPIRKLAEKLNLHGALSRKKIGFSAQINQASDRNASYRHFQDTILGTLEW